MNSQILKEDLIDKITFTGCAVVQHCYNGDVTFLWENGNFDPPRKIRTIEQIDTKFVRIDYVHKRNDCSKFGANLLMGYFWAND